LAVVGNGSGGGVSASVGITVGAAVGTSVGKSVGELVGVIDGVSVGVDVVGVAVVDIVVGYDVVCDINALAPLKSFLFFKRNCTA
jgi:hypothetical protein